MSEAQADDLVARLRTENSEQEEDYVKLCDEAANEIERLRRALAQEKHRAFQGGRICYRGFSYGVGSQVGINSLRSAIRSNGHE